MTATPAVTRVVVTDVTRLLGRLIKGRLPTGVDRVSLEYVRHYRGRSRAMVAVAGRWVALNGVDSQRLFNALLEPRRRSALAACWCVARSYLLSWRFGLTGAILLNTGHSGLEHPRYAARVCRHRLMPVYFLHDLIPITHPEFCRPGDSRKHRQRLTTMLSTGMALVVNSLDTGRNLAGHADRTGQVIPPWVVAPVAPARLPAPGSGRPIFAPYFVILGTIEPRKNHLLLLQLWRQLVVELGNQAPRLVVIGQRGWECEQVVDLLDRCEVLRDCVLERAKCGDQDLATWLHHAQALLFPSFVEGFGMPLVEALAMGVPVIASDLPVFRETAAAVPEYLDPLDGRAWKQSILAYTQPDSAPRRAQLSRMTAFHAATWAEHFSLVDGLMASCLQ